MVRKTFVSFKKKLIPVVLLLAAVGTQGEEIGAVNTSWKVLGPDNKVVVEAIDDPLVHGVTCYISRAKTGGLSGAVGIAEDKTEVSIACVKTGEVSVKAPLPRQEDIAKLSASFLIKKIHVVRMVDRARGVVTYLTYSDKLIDGSPKNSLSAVVLGPLVTVK
ncbi:MAG: CreA family protein [Ferrovum sp.]|nr:CreA family protein [Ferrovum sp.]